MLNRILVPTDFSDNGANALKYAQNLAEKYGAEIHLLHVIANDTAVAMGSDGFFAVSDEIMQDLHNAVTSKLQETSESVSGSVKNVVQDIREGAPFSEIIQYAKAKEIDLIVMGTHGRTGISHLLIGSVAEKVVRKARCPVLTVPSDGHEFTMP